MFDENVLRTTTRARPWERGDVGAEITKISLLNKLSEYPLALTVVVSRR